MERQLGKPLHIQAAEAFESPAFLQKLGMARADAERIFGGADWHQLLRDLVPIRGRISCADALAAFRPLLDQVAPDPADQTASREKVHWEGWKPVFVKQRIHIAWYLV